jgi:phosphoribosylformylglycinamidine synthase I
MTARIGVVTFPGSLDDRDARRAVQRAGATPVELWHGDASLRNVDAVILPGGFSYGDYLRCGAIARFAPVMAEIVPAAGRGLPVLGICNGFQILLEAGMLPGAMIRNRGLKFRCEHVNIRVEQTDTPFTSACRPQQVLRIPIAHGEGNYFTTAEDLRRLEQNRQVVFRYVNAEGAATDEANPNGSIDSIAGICNSGRNVVGLMPHPERACETALGSADGLAIFESVVRALAAGTLAPAESASA